MIAGDFINREARGKPIEKLLIPRIFFKRALPGQITCNAGEIDVFLFGEVGKCSLKILFGNLAVRKMNVR